MAVRSYLSIGDVLALLRDEFPDVTISKIRFLESQGLVDLERTPSGYRKFYEGDVAKLRWILRQQKENFLPLKVIRGRLEREWGADGGTGASRVAGDDEVDRLCSKSPQEELWASPQEVLLLSDDVEGENAVDKAAGLQVIEESGLAGGLLESEMVSRRGRPDDPSPVRAEPGVGSDAPLGSEEAELSGPQAHSEHLIAAHPVRDDVREFVSSGTADADEPDRYSDPGTDEAGPSDRDRTKRSESRTRARAVLRPRHPHEIDEASAGSHPLTEKVGVKRDLDHVNGYEVPAVLARVSAGMTGVSLTLDELARASGLSPEHVREFESYGLLRGTLVAGVAYYDEEALTVARIAAAFRRFGVEARHLRSYKNAADREAGFLLQLITPLLKQRNPDSRQRALDALAELTHLGQEMHSSLMRVALSPDLRATHPHA